LPALENHREVPPVEVTVPACHLLVPVGRVPGRVPVEGQVAWRALEGGDELVEEHVAQPLQGLDADGVLAAGQRGLAGQVAVLGGAAGDDPADGVDAQGVVVVLVLGPGQDAVDPGPDHLQEGVLGKVGAVGVVQGVREGPGEADPVVELADGQQTGVAG
jgi:hypothetical protein